MLHEDRIRLWSWAILVSFLLSTVVVFVGSSGIETPGGGRLGGDFPAFYGAAELIREGRGHELYSLDAQREVQYRTGALHNDGKGHYIFAYPPFVGAALVPLTLLSFPNAYRVYTLFMFVAWFVAMKLLARAFPVVGDHLVPALALSIAFYPLFRGVTGGQNSALCLLCFAGILHSVNNPTGMGRWLGAWFFKTQHALLFIPTVVAVGALRACFPIALWASTYFAISAYVSGLNWISVWLNDGVRPFFDLDVAASLHHFTTVRSIVLRLTDNGSLAAWFGAVILLLFLVFSAYVAIKDRRSTETLKKRLCLIGTLAPFVALHGLFYDATLLVPGLMVIASSRKVIDYIFVSGVVLFSWLDSFSASLPFQPTIVMIVIVAVRLLLTQE